MEASNQQISLQLENLILKTKVQELQQKLHELDSLVDSKEQQIKRLTTLILQKGTHIDTLQRALNRIATLIFALQQLKLIDIATQTDVDQFIKSAKYNLIPPEVFDDEEQFCLKIVNLMQISTADLVHKLYKRDEAISSAISSDTEHALESLRKLDIKSPEEWKEINRDLSQLFTHSGELLPLELSLKYSQKQPLAVPPSFSQ
jgi:hypothetical protein